MTTPTKAIAGVTVAFLAGTGWWALHHFSPASGKPDAEAIPGSPPLVGEEAASGLASSLRNLKSPSSATPVLCDLKAALLRMDRREAVAWITKYFATGNDFSTELDITISQDGTLTEWPALRVFLLDVLYIIDPVAGAELGRNVLRSPTTADEWALAMRNVGAGSPAAEDVALLKAKSAEMLRNGAWSKEASAGYLESFDVIVHTRNVELAPELIARARDTANRGVRHAAFLTLDRLTLTDPGAMMEELIPSAIAQPETALMVSNMVARADVRDPAQRRLVENYLLDEKRTAPEVQAFTGVFPNANQFVSSNLLTKVPAIPGTELAARDRAALEVVHAWIVDPRFSRLKPAKRRDNFAALG